ncbi:hypothetical protein [Dyadobacter sandarakinus]|uniref:Helix-turn-helix domain-containing protein n=1 Tax=Dyadobacter sandarakinus TaxID=2747268 RepID=A0ABX7ICJ0_9BACT|nr:hypothetical protein [Dyadobacter sandarakinus]QRR03177.1 hypothetical protein HWI92_20800 [Dyadobacter sandarakinus]
MNDQQLSELIESSLRRVLESKPEAAADTSDTLLDTKEAARLTKYKETSIYGLVKRKKDSILQNGRQATLFPQRASGMDSEWSAKNRR